MKTKCLVVNIVTIGALALLHATPSSAEVKERSQYVEAYGGVLFGDDLIDGQMAGRKPKLDDEVTYGVRYGYNFTKTLGLEASLGFSPNEATQSNGSNVNLDLWTFDIDGVYNFDTGSRFVPYVLAGIGYAKSDLDHDLTLPVNGQSMTIRDSDGFTANAGLGLKVFATESLFFRLEGRYRYLDKIVDRFDKSLNTAEASLSIGWQF